jgi:hypothetical protein
MIVVGQAPTAFRARYAEDLLPTLKQLSRTQPTVRMIWFERGRFWESPSHAKDAQLRRRREARERGRDWRPGGTHKDPRSRFEISRDEKRARFKRRLGRKPPVKPKRSG